jgi:16S rRNA processing protein RimM
VIETGSNDVYVVENEQGKQVLIPALKSVVREVSLNERKIVVELPEGL